LIGSLGCQRAEKKFLAAPIRRAHNVAVSRCAGDSHHCYLCLETNLGFTRTYQTVNIGYLLSSSPDKEERSAGVCFGMCLRWLDFLVENLSSGETDKELIRCASERLTQYHKDLFDRIQMLYEDENIAYAHYKNKFGDDPVGPNKMALENHVVVSRLNKLDVCFQCREEAPSRDTIVDILQAREQNRLDRCKVGAPWKRRAYLLASNRHAMAAFHGRSSIWFFNPNTGVYSMQEDAGFVGLKKHLWSADAVGGKRWYLESIQSVDSEKCGCHFDAAAAEAAGKAADKAKNIEEESERKRKAAEKQAQIAERERQNAERKKELEASKKARSAESSEFANVLNRMGRGERAITRGSTDKHKFISGLEKSAAELKQNGSPQAKELLVKVEDLIARLKA